MWWVVLSHWQVGPRGSAGKLQLTLAAQRDCLVPTDGDEICRGRF